MFVNPEPLAAPAYKPREARVAVPARRRLLPASAARKPLVLPCSSREPLVLALVPPGHLLPASAALELLVLLVFKPLEALVAEPLPLGGVNLKKLIVVTKNRSSSSLAGASSQIAPLGRSGIALPPQSRFPWFAPESAPVKKRRFQTIRGNEINGPYPPDQSP